MCSCVLAGVIHRQPNAAPNDPGAFELRDHFAVPVAAGAGGLAS